MNPHVANACYEIIRRYKATVIYGYPSMIAEFCEHVKAQDAAFGSLLFAAVGQELHSPLRPDAGFGREFVGSG
jgi:phenylacetate-coenzyme A ligase PaaK-like adenylate-forming protein